MENPLDIPTPPPVLPTTLDAPTAVDLSGKKLGDFELVRRLGQGGMGQVYLARQLSLKRQVAVKILRSDLAQNESALLRFQHEAEAVAKATHANIVQVYAIDQCDGLHYMALEYVEGRNLRDFINRKGPPELPLAVNIMRQVAAALLRAGELGIVHRDIKPENILLTRKGEVKVADFGLSRIFTEDRPLNITQSGVSMGTPLYMSPEQVQGHAVDPRTDIYSFGVTCYHMLAGEPPFRGQTPFEVAVQHVQNEPPPLSQARPDLPADLCAIVHRMMAKKPVDRYQNAREILRDLARLREGFPTAALQLSTSSSASNPAIPGVSPAGSSWRRWAASLLLLAAACGAGAAVHWKMSPQIENRNDRHEAEVVETPVDPGETAEKELLKKLRDGKNRSDLEVTNGVIELAMLYVGQKKPEKALQLFEVENLRKLPAVIEVRNLQKSPTQYLNMLGSLGKGVVLAEMDRPKESLDEFRKVMAPPVVPKVKSLNPLENFLWRYGQWKREVADALDRNAKNLKEEKLEESFERYRHYSSKMP